MGFGCWFSAGTGGSYVRTCTPNPFIKPAAESFAKYTCTQRRHHMSPTLETGTTRHNWRGRSTKSFAPALPQYTVTDTLYHPNWKRSRRLRRRVACHWHARTTWRCRSWWHGVATRPPREARLGTRPEYNGHASLYEPRCLSDTTGRVALRRAT